MKIMTYDWETAGLPIKGARSTDPGHPDGVSLTCIIDDDAGTTRTIFSTLLKQTKPIPEEVIAIHGVTDEMCRQFGMDPQDALRVLDRLIDTVDVTIAFGAHFDHKFSKVMCHRNGRTDIRARLDAKPYICLQHPAFKFMKGAGAGGAYWKKLTEVHEFLFGKPHSGPHTSYGDARATRSVYYELVARGVLFEPKQHRPGDGDESGEAA